MFAFKIRGGLCGFSNAYVEAKTRAELLLQESVEKRQRMFVRICAVFTTLHVFSNIYWRGQRACHEWGSQ